MDKFVIRTPRSEKMPPPSPQPMKAFKQLTLEGLKGVVVLEELERAKLALRRRDASSDDKLRQLRLLAQKTPTAAILQSSGIGAAVSATRDDPDASVAAEAKRVHRSWKAYNSSKANRPSIEVRCDARTQRLRDSARAMIKEALKSTLKAPQSSSCGENVDSESLAGKIDERHLSDIGAVVSTTSLGYSKGLRVDLDRYHCVMNLLRKEESDDDDEVLPSVKDNEEKKGKEFTPVLRETIKKRTSTRSVATLDDTQQSSSMKKNASDVTASDSTRGKENLQHASSLSSKSQIIVPGDSRIEVGSNRSQSTEKKRDRQDDIEAKYAMKDKKHKRKESHIRSTRNDNDGQKLDERDKKTKSEEKQSGMRSAREKESKERKREDKGEENGKKSKVIDMKSKDKSLLEGHGNSKNKLEVGEKLKKSRSREEGGASSNRSSENKFACDLSSDKFSGKPALRLDDRRVLNSKQCESIEGVENMSSDQHTPDITVTKQASSTKEGRTSANSVSSSNNKRMRDGDSEQGHCKKSKRDSDSSTLLDESGNKSVKEVVSQPERKSEKLEESTVDEPSQATNSDDHSNKDVAYLDKAAVLVRSECSNTGVEISKSESQTKSSCNCNVMSAGRVKDSCAYLTDIETRQIVLPKECNAKNNKDPHVLQSIGENKSGKDDCETPLTRVSTELGRHSSENVPPADRDHSQERRSYRGHKHDKERRPSHKKKHSRKDDRERSDGKKCVTDPLTDGEKYDVLSEAIERELFSENNRLINKCYRKTIRRIVFTLKHQDRIRKKVLTGKYSAGRVLAKCWDE